MDMSLRADFNNDNSTKINRVQSDVESRIVKSSRHARRSSLPANEYDYHDDVDDAIQDDIDYYDDLDFEDEGPDSDGRIGIT